MQRLNLSDLQYVKEIGSGSYGSIHIYSKKDVQYAIKKAANRFEALSLYEYYNDDTDVYVAMREICFLSLIAYADKSNQFSLDYCGFDLNLNLCLGLANLDLMVWIRTKPPKERQVEKIMDLLLKNLKLVHSLGIIHNDIKPQNVLLQLDSQQNVQKVAIADFGISQIFSSLNGTTQNYMAPDKFEAQLSHSYGFQDDCWAMGKVLYELTLTETEYNDLQSSLNSLRSKEYSVDEKMTQQHGKVFYDFSKKNPEYQELLRKTFATMREDADTKLEPYPCHKEIMQLLAMSGKRCVVPEPQKLNTNPVSTLPQKIYNILWPWYIEFARFRYTNISRPFSFVFNLFNRFYNAENIPNDKIQAYVLACDYIFNILSANQVKKGNAFLRQINHYSESNYTVLELDKMILNIFDKLNGLLWLPGLQMMTESEINEKFRV